MATNFLDKDGLIHFWAKIKEKFVRKELKTGSLDTYKVLSDNNLTDAGSASKCGVQAAVERRGGAPPETAAIGLESSVRTP